MDRISKLFAAAAATWCFMAIVYSFAGEALLLRAIFDGVIAVFCMLASVAAKLSE